MDVGDGIDLVAKFCYLEVMLSTDGGTVRREPRTDIKIVETKPSSKWTGSGNPMNSDEKFIDVLQKNGLHQHITTPTRQRGDDEPHVLDLVFNQ